MRCDARGARPVDYDHKQGRQPAFYIERDDEFYADGTDGLLLIEKVYLCTDNEDGELIEDWERFYELDRQRHGKELYIPEDILSYVDDEYFENTPQTRAMLRYLENRRPAGEKRPDRQRSYAARWWI